jgi:hypothetical protein
MVMFRDRGSDGDGWEEVTGAHVIYGAKYDLIGVHSGIVITFLVLDSDLVR